MSSSYTSTPSAYMVYSRTDSLNFLQIPIATKQLVLMSEQIVEQFLGIQESVHVPELLSSQKQYWKKLMTSELLTETCTTQLMMLQWGDWWYTGHCKKEL